MIKGVAVITRSNDNDIILVCVRRQVELRVLIGHHIEKYVIENNISKKHHSPVLIASPPRLKAVKRLLSLLQIHVVVGYWLPDGGCHGKLRVVLKLIGSFKTNFIDRESLSVNCYVYESIKRKVACLVEGNRVESINSMCFKLVLVYLRISDSNWGD